MVLWLCRKCPYFEDAYLVVPKYHAVCNLYLLQQKYRWQKYGNILKNMSFKLYYPLRVSVCLKVFLIKRKKRNSESVCTTPFLYALEICQRMVVGPAALPSPGSVLRMQSLRPPPALLGWKVMQFSKISWCFAFALVSGWMCPLKITLSEVQCPMWWCLEVRPLRGS